MFERERCFAAEMHRRGGVVIQAEEIIHRRARIILGQTAVRHEEVEDLRRAIDGRQGAKVNGPPSVVFLNGQAAQRRGIQDELVDMSESPVSIHAAGPGHDVQNAGIDDQHLKPGHSLLKRDVMNSSRRCT